MASEFAKQHGIPDLPDDGSTLGLDGQHIRSFSDLAQGWDKYRGSIAPPGQILQFGGSIPGVVMFIDIGSYTQRSHQLTPAQTAFWVNRFFSGLEPWCEEAHATIDKVIGDCLMLVLSPLLGCNEPLRKATELALHILRWDGWAYYPHIGISEGKFWLGYSGPPKSMNISVFGDAVNLASRLTSAAAERSVAMQTENWDAVKDRVEIDEMFSVIEGKKSLPDFQRIKYVVIHRETLWIPQADLPPLVIGEEVRPPEFLGPSGLA